jgi:hypothetical protein
VPLDYLLADRKADPRPQEIALAVQTLKGGEDALGMLFFEPDFVILHQDFLGSF